MSYAKQMMEAAEMWLQANPDPEDPFVRLPSQVKRTPLVSKIEWDRYQRALREIKDPVGREELRAQLEHLKKTVAEVKETEDAVIEGEKELERAINAPPAPGHAKIRGDSDYHATLGRWFLSWARDGYNVFDLSQDFVAAMLLTDPREIEFDELRLPFRGILVTIPTGFASGVEGHAYTKIHICELQHRHRKTLDVGQRVMDTLDGLSPEAVQKVLADANAKLREAHDRSPIEASLLGGVADLVEHHAVLIHATDGQHTLDTIIEAKDLTWKTFEALPDDVTEDKDKEARRTLGQIVFGLLAYLTATKDIIERDPIRKEKQRKAREGQQRVKYWDVGRTVKISPELVRIARTGAREVAFRIKHRFMVMGHYRNQACGPKRSERKRIWIAPFEKGPEEGAKLVHTYKPETNLNGGS